MLFRSRLAETYADGVDVALYACPDRLVELVELGITEGPNVENLVRPIVDQAQRESRDVMVLGCTHYVFLRRAIEGLLGPRVTVVDTGPAVARQAARVIDDQGIGSHDAARIIDLHSSGDVNQLRHVADLLRVAYCLPSQPGGESAEEREAV